jgi:hypothetical protein
VFRCGLIFVEEASLVLGQVKLLPEVPEGSLVGSGPVGAEPDGSPALGALGSQHRTCRTPMPVPSRSYAGCLVKWWSHCGFRQGRSRRMAVRV